MAPVRVLEDGVGLSVVEEGWVPACYAGEVEGVLLSAEAIEARLTELAAEVSAAVGAEEPLALLCVLKGAFPTFAALARLLRPLRKGPTFFHFLRLSSYQDERSTGTVTLEGGKPGDLSGAHVLAVEDIVETGRTMAALEKVLGESGAPKSFRTLSLLHKRTKAGGSDFKPTFTGFSVPDRFVIGFGLDFNEFYRELPFIGVISQQGIQKRSKTA